MVDGDRNVYKIKNPSPQYKLIALIRFRYCTTANTINTNPVYN